MIWLDACAWLILLLVLCYSLSKMVLDDWWRWSMKMSDPLLPEEEGGGRSTLTPSHASIARWHAWTHSYTCLLCALAPGHKPCIKSKKKMIALSHHTGARHGVGIENSTGYALEHPPEQGMKFGVKNAGGASRVGNVTFTPSKLTAPWERNDCYLVARSLEYEQAIGGQPGGFSDFDFQLSNLKKGFWGKPHTLP